jgi:proteasome lid subunit RPN8/RPN11
VRGLWLTPQQARQIAGHARQDAPREACGVIAGRDDRAIEIIPVTNTAEDPEHAYTLDPAALTKAMMSLQTAGLGIIGFYHSHPAGDPVPSGIDIALATYPDTAYLIVGLKGEPRLAAWQMRYGDVQRLPLTIGDAPPAEREEPLSPAQKVAIIVSALLALVVMLVWSLSLLPPAPPIPIR